MKIKTMVHDLDKERERRVRIKHLTSGRIPLYISYKDGTISGTSTNLNESVETVIDRVVISLRNLEKLEFGK